MNMMINSQFVIMESPIFDYNFGKEEEEKEKEKEKEKEIPT